MILDTYIIRLNLDSSQAAASLKNFRSTLQGKAGKPVNVPVNPVMPKAPDMGKALSMPAMPAFGGLKQLFGIGAGLTIFSEIKQGIGTAAQFDTAISRAGAATKATVEEVELLREESKKIGSETIFKASEAARAIEILGKNGLTVEQTLGGALDSTMDLSAAMSSRMGPTADLITDVMKQFNISAEDTTDAINILAGAAFESKFDFDDMRLAFAQAGGVSGGVQIPLNQFAAALATTSSLFASGSDAGTSFKTFLTRLTPVSKESAEAMEEMGLSFFDAEGKMRSMEDVASQLKKSFTAFRNVNLKDASGEMIEIEEAISSVTDEKQLAALKDIFGVDAMRTAIGLIRTGADGIREADRAIRTTDAGGIAQKQLGVVDRALERISSAWEAFNINLFGGEFQTNLAKGIEGLATVIRFASNIPPEFYGMAAAIGGALFIGKRLGGLFKKIGGIALPALKAIAAAFGIGGLAGGVGIAKGAFKAFTAIFRANPFGLLITGILLVVQYWERLAEIIGTVKEGIASVFTGAPDIVERTRRVAEPSAVASGPGAGLRAQSSSVTVGDIYVASNNPSESSKDIHSELGPMLATNLRGVR